MLGFEIKLALRHLLAGRGQTVLTVSTVAAGVVVIVFISSLIFGIQSHISEMLTDMLPHVTVSTADLEPKPLVRVRGAEIISAKIERQNPQRKHIENWQETSEAIGKLPHVLTVAPAVFDQGFASRGGKQLGVFVYGCEPSQLDGIMRVRKYIVEGHYLGLTADQAVITYRMAKELNIALGDRVRVASNQGVSSSFRVVGIYDTGQDEDMYKVFLTLRAAQSLYKTGTAVQSILVKADDLYHADMVADEISAVLPYKVKSWSRQYPQFASSIWVYTATAFLISGFSLVAAAFAIASVLVVSVLQKGKQIGILKSMGATRAQIFRVFLLEGFGISILGASLGAALGCALVLGLDLFKAPLTRPDSIPQPLFPSLLSFGLVGSAMFAAVASTVIAAALPARRAASLDPVQVMR